MAVILEQRLGVASILRRQTREKRHIALLRVPRRATTKLVCNFN